MAEETTVQEPLSPPQNARREALAFVVGVAGWLVPGLGHALLKMWGRALICFFTVGVFVWVLATAGVFNLLAALHAYEAARGRKA